MDIAIVEQFQKISNIFLDNFFSFITKFGEIIPFIVIFFLLYWCVENKIAMQFMCTYLIGVALNSVVKQIFQRPRPYVKSETIINKYGSDGYSFPSGHTSSATLAFGGAYCALKNKVNKALKIMFAILNLTLICLVMISRIYLGQHYLSDVLCGFLLSVLWLIIAPKIYKLFGRSDHKVLLFIIPVAMLVAFISASPFAVNKEFVTIYLICGLLSGVVLGYFLDRQFVETSKKSALFLLIKGATCTLITLGVLGACIVVSKHLITFFVSFMILGLIATVGYSALFEHINKFLIKRRNKNENL